MSKFGRSIQSLLNANCVPDIAGGTRIILLGKDGSQSTLEMRDGYWKPVQAPDPTTQDGK